MRSLILAAMLLPAQAQDNTTKLLKVFREEFVALAPGEKDFPAAFEMGCTSGETRDWVK